MEGLDEGHERRGELPRALREGGDGAQRGERELPDLVRLGAAERIGPELGDHLRLGLGHLLDVHPAGAGEDEHHPPAVTVEGDPAVDLVGDVEAGLAPDAAHREALDVHGEDARRLGAGLLGGVDDRDPARLAAAADRDLRLDRDPAQLARGRLGLLRGAGQAAGGGGDARLRELLLRLVLEELHRGMPPVASSFVNSAGQDSVSGTGRALAGGAAWLAPRAAGFDRRAAGRAGRLRWPRRRARR